MMQGKRSRMRRFSQEVSDRDYEMHVLLISKSRLKSSIGTSTLMAGFALVGMTSGLYLEWVYQVCLMKTGSYG